MQKIKNCIYCDDNNLSTHFLCEVCGVGMCDECYDSLIEHDLHYHRILENCDSSREIELITKSCNCIEPEYICEICVYKILK